MTGHEQRAALRTAIAVFNLLWLMSGKPLR